jgi:hypothetical protein
MLRHLVIALFVLALVVLCSASRAKADDVFTWTLPASPPSETADCAMNMIICFTVPGVSFSENGGVPQTGVFDFFSSSMGGGFDLGPAPLCTIASSCILDESGAQLYTGMESAPTFVPGTYSLMGFFDSLNAGGTGTLTITLVDGIDQFKYEFVPAPTVPEPSSLLLLGTGVLGLLGFARKKIFA